MSKIQWPLVKILVADDDESLLSIFKIYFKKLGCVGAFVSSGREAIEIVQQYRFDLCFFDLLMTDLGGIEATIAIRKSFDKTIPIIGMSVSLTDAMREKCLNIGMDRLISKPIVLDTVRQTIEEYVPSEVVKLPDSDQFWSSPQRK